MLGDDGIPVSFPRPGGPDQSFIGSLRSGLGGYAATRTKHMKRPLEVAMALAVARLSGLLIGSAGGDGMAMLFNLPFSTVLLPDLAADDMLRHVACASHAIGPRLAIRGLNDAQHMPILAALRHAGFILIPWRQIFLVPQPAVALSRSGQVARDLRLRRKHKDLTVATDDVLDDEELDAAVAMYRQLYIHKYSVQNPDFSAGFLRAALRTGALRFLTVRDPSGTVIGFVGYYCNGTTMTTPMIGYAMDRASTYPIYRLLMLAQLQLAAEVGLALNWSSGVPEFKALRGGEPALEYIAIAPQGAWPRLVFSGFAATNRFAFTSPLLRKVVQRI
ncbi:GNAT family N-acetyltransferase [Falsiroseomonas selenitidurans]|uniref:GNAT family N-acetyltransferase n=1 Tax=Falsiroseomonas selenitidurans TaxID=2716335 RepID=A0ABX1E5N4_9PROT|nr:GNAT family N-acetyltransferase [Falsiroseomonas selenitidurans]NKC31062.1 GNAT family N-acetyltransferase [Falsiroseomonas selenitidurans]